MSQTLREAVAILEQLYLENAPAWLIEGQVENVRVLTARLEGLALAALDGDARKAADAAIKKADRKAAARLQPMGYTGPGWLNR